MRALTLVLAVSMGLALVGCRGSDDAAPPTEPTPATGAEESTPSLIQYDDQGRRISRGFAKPGPRRLESLTEAEQAKLDALQAAERAERNVAIPEEWAGRRTQAESDSGWAFDVYRDGTLVRRIAGRGHEEGTALSSVLSPEELTGLRSALAHGTSGARWFAAKDLTELQIRLNRQERVKLESTTQRGRRLPKKKRGAGQGGGTGDGQGGGTGDGKTQRVGPKNRVSKRELRDSEIQGLRWIELRSQESTMVLGEPDAKLLAIPDAP